MVILWRRFERDQLIASLNATLNYKDLSTADMVIEAVFEDIDIKHQVIKETEQVSKKIALWFPSKSLILFWMFTYVWKFP